MPPAASAAGGAIVGPRFLPGTYTLKLTENGVVYESKLTVAPDPRSTHRAADRQAQYQLSLKLAGLLNTMTDDVLRITAMRQALEARAAKVGAGDSLAARLRGAAATVDSLRKKIVATTEGGAITGEERLRENLADLYGNVVNYEGRPSATQVERAEAIARELGDVMQGFDAWAGKEVPALNAALAARGMPPLPGPAAGGQPR